MTKLPTIDIRGKEYVMVKDRITAFHELYPHGSITTEILTNDDKSVVVKAVIKTDINADARTFTGHSEAYRGVGQMGQVPVEVAETSAVGRAMAMLGIGIIQSVSSADEINKASYVVDKIKAGQTFTADEFDEAQGILPDEVNYAAQVAKDDWKEKHPPVKRNPGIQYGKKATGERLSKVLSTNQNNNHNDVL